MGIPTTIITAHQENMMNLFEKSEKLRELRSLVEDYPTGTPTMLAGESIDRLKAADPDVNITRVLFAALEEAADKAEKEKRERDRETEKQVRRELRVQQATIATMKARRNLESAHLLPDQVTTRAEAEEVDALLHKVYRDARTAGQRVRAAFGIPAAKTARPRHRFSHNPHPRTRRPFR